MNKIRREGERGRGMIQAKLWAYLGGLRKE